MLSRSPIECEESSANTNLGSLSGPSEEAKQGSSLVFVDVPVSVAHLIPEDATAATKANTTAADTAITSGKATPLSVANMG